LRERRGERREPQKKEGDSPNLSTLGGLNVCSATSFREL